MLVIKTKVCRECGRELPIEMFSKTKAYADGYLPFCKECYQKKKNRYDFLHHNIAFERIPWPFNHSWHEMDIGAIETDIKLREYGEKTAEGIINIKKKKKIKKEIRL